MDQLAHSKFLVFYMPRTKEILDEDQVVDAKVVNLNLEHAKN